MKVLRRVCLIALGVSLLVYGIYLWQGPSILERYDLWHEGQKIKEHIKADEMRERESLRMYALVESGYEMKRCDSRRLYESIKQRDDRDACFSLLGLLAHGDLYTRLDVFGRLAAIAKLHSEFKDILKSAIAVASVDPNGVVRSEVCAELRKNGNEDSTGALLNMVAQEYRIPRDCRWREMRWPGTVKSEEPDRLLYECMGYLLEVGKIEKNAECIELRFREGSSGDFRYFLAHVLYKLGRKPELDIMIEGVTNSSSPFAKIEIIRDLEEMGDKRALPALKMALKDEFCDETHKWKINLFPVRMAAQSAIDKIDK